MTLVLVLVFLVFLSAMAIAFLLNSATELKASKGYAEGGRAQVLAQSAAGLVMAQISDATRGVGNNNSPTAWASQPGMIRTYTENGGPDRAFKLYSWDRMTTSGAFDPKDPGETIPDDWFDRPALFVDLNEPVNAEGGARYPIIDGNDLTLTVTDADGRPRLTYNDNGEVAVEGFSISATDTPRRPDPGANPVPLPVKWLYILKEGQIIAPDDGGTDVATFSGSLAPTEKNPIVGRVAFWTDDETAKLNINVASEGSYWDTPRAVTNFEDRLKSNQPVTGEYQRYPGHPAMTSLSTVLKKPSGSTLTDAQWAEFIYKLVPRVAAGGSQFGTVNTAWASPTAPSAIEPDSDRLYATVDELFFAADQTSNATAPGSDRVLNDKALDRAGFFLTTASRAPDVNLFNLPRVSIWPITVDASGNPLATPFDELIAFCSTMRTDLGEGAYRYYFQRQDPDSPTTDLPTGGSVTGLGRNRMLLEYLRSLAGRNIPGFGGSFAEKYGPDANQILTQMFDFIRGATNLQDCNLPADQRYAKGTPGVGEAPWNGRIGEGQVVPIDDTTNGTHGFGRYRTVQGASLLFIGQVDGDDPVVEKDTEGNPKPPFPENTSQVDVTTGLPLPTADQTAVSPGQRRIQAMFLPQFFCPTVGAPWNIGNFQWSVDLSELRWGPANERMFPQDPDTRYNQNKKSLDETAFGDQFGILQVRQAAKIISNQIDVPKDTGTFHFGGGTVTITIYAADRTSIPPPSSRVVQTVKLYFPPADFPIPDLAPTDVYEWNNQQPKKDSDGNEITYNYRSFDGCTGTYNPADPAHPLPVSGGRCRAGGTAAHWFGDEDVVRSVTVRSGDTRLVAAKKNVPESDFAPLGDYFSTSARVLGTHNFFDGYGRPYYGAKLGRLVPGLNYEGYKDAAEPGISTRNKRGPNAFNLGKGRYSLATDAPLEGVAAGKHTSFTSGDVPGDFDNGPFNIRDGPFINKPDEGDRSSKSDVDPYEWKLKAKASGKITETLFTPNRELASAVAFGSLPTGVFADRPWQTLLFRPEPGHPGSAGYKGDGTPAPNMPADHLWLDFFHMPVVEPYAISEPLSTAGRINMNHQIVPFTYVNRDSGIRALLKSEKVIAIPETHPEVYKNNVGNPNARQHPDIRFDVNVEETLKGFRRRFETEGDIFRSASEICELPIVPIDPNSNNDTFETMDAYWASHRLTGDNSRERIYATLYPRLTTKSNTFTIHVRAQALQKAPGTDPATWDEKRDRITGEYRGSQTIERFVDPNDPDLPDFADPSTSTPLSEFYRFRIIQTKPFAP